MNWKAPFDRGSGHDQARPRHRHRLQGFDLADNLDRHRQCLRRTEACTLYCSTVDMGQGSDTANGAARRRGAQHPGRVGQGRASRHRRHALRHGDARFALDVSHGQCRASSRPRTPRPSSRRWRASSACRRARNVPVAELFQKKYKMQAGNIIGTGSYIPNYVPPDHERPDAERDAVLDGRRYRRRGRGRYRDRPRPRDQADQRRRRRPAGQSAHRRDADFRAPPSCSSASPCRRRWSSTPARSPTPRSPTTRSRAFSTSRTHASTKRSRPSRAPARSAPRASARAARLAYRRRSPTPSRMPVGVRLTALPLTAEAVYRGAARRARQAAGGR